MPRGITLALMQQTKDTRKPKITAHTRMFGTTTVLVAFRLQTIQRTFTKEDRLFLKRDFHHRLLAYKLDLHVVFASDIFPSKGQTQPKEHLLR